MKKLYIFLQFVFIITTSTAFSQVTLDPNFGVGGKVVTAISSLNDVIYGMSIQGDGKIVTCGITYTGSKYVQTVARYNPNGNLDPNFGTNGIITTNLGSFQFKPNAIEIQSDGRILIAGTHEDGAMNFVFLMCRYNSDGTPDTNFGTNGIVLTDFSPSGGQTNGAIDIAIQSNDKIILSGYGSIVGGFDGNITIARYNIDGALDTTFGTLGKAEVSIGLHTTTNGATIDSNDTTSAVKIQSDGKIIIVGYTDAETIGSQYNLAIVRLTTNGAVDTFFGTNGKVVADFGGNDKEFNLALTPDNKLIVCGTIYFNSDQNSKTVIAKFNNDGSVDTLFGTNGKTITQINTTTMNDSFGSIVLQNDGKILVCGYSVVSGAVPDFLLMRFNSNGILDTTFNTTGYITTDFNSNIDVAHVIAIQNDGKIVLAGTAGPNNNYDFALARYIDGSLATTSFESTNFIIYPNPTSSLLTIYNAKNATIKSIEIYNTLGQLVVLNSSNENNTIEVSNLESGTYFIKIYSDNTTETAKFVKN